MMEPDMLEAYYKRFSRYPNEYYAEPILNPIEKTILNVFYELETMVRIPGGRIPFDGILLMSQTYDIDFFFFLNIIRKIEYAVIKIRDINNENNRT